MKKKIKLSESRLKNIIARVIKEEFSYPDTYNHTYNRRFTNDYQGLFSMIKQYGCNAKFGGDDLNESRLNRIIKESVRRVLKENTEMVNNKNYVFDPSTRTGIDRTMGHDIKFRYTGNDLENFTNLLRRSDGDDFNPDWLESWGGVEFDDNGYDSSYGPQQDAQFTQELRNKIKAAGGMLVQGDINQGLEKYVSPATMNMIKKVGYAVVWIIELYDNEYYVSKKPYQSDESAYMACDKVLKMLGQDLNAEVYSLFYEDGELMTDILMYKEMGDDFWMD